MQRITCVCLVYFLIFVPGSAHGKEPVNLVLSSLSGLFIGFWQAKEANLFDKYGLEARLIYIQSAPTVLQAVMAGEGQIAVGGPKPVVDAKLAGGNAVLFGAVTDVPAFYIMASPEIQSINDLKGKPVGVTRFGGSADFAMRLVLKRYGLEPIKDVPIIQINGGLAAVAAALSKKLVFAAPFSAPANLVAKRFGAKVLIDLGAAGIYYPHNAIFSTSDFLQRHRPIALNFLRAYAEGIAYAVNNKSSALQVIKKYTREDNAESLEATYNYAMDYVLKVPHVNPRGIAEVLRQSDLPSAREAKPDDFVDPSLVRQLEQEGFFRRVFGK
jgi:NitT/TauT family transport system substrate-binding protein